MYGKIFACTFTGSMVGAGSDVFAVWSYVIANASGGTVELNPLLLAVVIGSTPERMQDAIDFLSRPDAASKSQEDGGRRLVKIGPFAYRVPNHGAYRAIRNTVDRQAYMRDYMRRKRSQDEAQETDPVNTVLTPVNTVLTPVNTCKHQLAHTEAETEAESGSEAETKPDASAPFSSPEFKTAWREWEQHRREIRKKLTPTTRRRQLEQLGAMSEADAIQSIRQSVANGWTGLFEPKGKASSKSNHAGIQENIPF